MSHWTKFGAEVDGGTKLTCKQGGNVVYACAEKESNDGIMTEGSKLLSPCL